MHGAAHMLRYAPAIGDDRSRREASA